MYKQYQVFGPWAGVVDNVPAPNKPPNAFEDVLNFLCRKGRLQDRPAFTTFGSPPDGAILRNAITFDDVLNNFHTLILTANDAYFLTAGPVYNLLTNGDVSGTGLPFGMIALNQSIYFANGSRYLSYVDGSAAVQVAGDVPGSAFYMGALANHAILVNTIEPPSGTAGSILYPHRIRWSGSGTPNVWTGFGSGFTDILDQFSVFTGYATLGRNGYFFRKRGITVGFATGVGDAPFQFEPYSSSLDGVGNDLPYSLDTYGNLAVFVARNDIYQFSGQELQPIGGKAKEAIFNDLAQARGDVVRGRIVPRLADNFDCLSYWLSVPGPNVTWVYLFDDDSWQRVEGQSGGMSFIGGVSIQ